MRHIVWQARSRLHIQADGAHEIEGVAVLHHTFADPVVEDHLAILDAVFEVDVASARNPGERQVVSGHQADGTARQQSPNDSLAADQPVMRIGPVEQFVEQKQSGTRQVKDVANARNLGIKL